MNDTEYISERAITTTITVNHQRIMLMSVNFLHSRYADHHVGKMYKTIEKHTNSGKKSIQIVGGDFNTEWGPGYGVERVSVGPHTLKEGNKRGDWMKQWLTELHSTQHDVQKNAWKANYQQIAHTDQKKTPEIQ